MLAYTLKRIGLGLLILTFVMVAMYAAVFLVPGDPATVALGPRATPELKRMLTERMGLDQPVWWQIVEFFRNALTGNLGYDVWSNRPVSTLVMEALPNTLILGLTALAAALLIGVPLGCLSVVKRGTIADAVIGVLSVSVIAVPSFVVAIYSLPVFAVALRWLRASGAGALGRGADGRARRGAIDHRLVDIAREDRAVAAGGQAFGEDPAVGDADRGRSRRLRRDRDTPGGGGKKDRLEHRPHLASSAPDAEQKKGMKPPAVVGREWAGGLMPSALHSFAGARIDHIIFGIALGIPFAAPFRGKDHRITRFEPGHLAVERGQRHAAAGEEHEFVDAVIAFGGVEMARPGFIHAAFEFLVARLHDDIVERGIRAVRFPDDFRLAEARPGGISLGNLVRVNDLGRSGAEADGGGGRNQ